MKRNRLRNGLVSFIVVAVLLALAVLLGVFRPSTVAPGVQQPLTDAQMQATFPKARIIRLRASGAIDGYDLH